jgi:hypothetical protein
MYSTYIMLSQCFVTTLTLPFPYYLGQIVILASSEARLRQKIIYCV